MEFHAEKERFQSPEEEIAYLKEELAKREGTIGRAVNTQEREHIAKETIAAYQKMPSERVLSESFKMPQKEAEGIALRLSPEKHDTVIEELFGYLTTKGIKNAFDIAEKLGNPHVMDDFHRFLVQYLATTRNTMGMSDREPLYRELDMRLFEVALPKWGDDKNDRTRALKEMLSAMEQFYAGMMSVSDSGRPVAGKNYFTIEVALPHIGSEVMFYVSIPSTKTDLFTKQIHAVFPDAKTEEVPDDYNIFNDGGASVGAYAVSSRNPVFPLKTYDEFDHDPLNVILNVFARIAEKGEGAAIQIVIAPAGNHFVQRYGYALEQIRKGVSTKHAVNLPESFGGEMVKTVGEAFFGIGEKKKKKDSSEPDKPIDDIAIEQIKKKTSRTILNTNIRVIASAATETRAKAILHDLESAFHQFGNSLGNGILFREGKGRALLPLFKEFSYRAWNDAESFPLNLAELTTILHFPVVDTSSPILHSAKAGSAPAAIGELPREGTLLGVNSYRGVETDVYLSDSDRVRHLYVIGQTGAGKSVFLKNLTIQDIHAGRGVCFIDPHGDTVQDILANIPKERLDDVIYFDPAYTARPMGLNMLEFDPRFPEQKTLIVDELFGVFKKLYGAIPESMGPAFEQYFRGGALLVMEHPESGNTLLEILRVLSDKKFRDLKLSHTKNPQLLMFWQNAEKTSGEQGLSNYVPYVTSKFDIFTQNEIMRPIIAQEKSAFNMRDIMDNKKILLVNLSKGRLGDINANLIGLIIVGKILMAALSRADSFGKDLPAFYLYLDEFQNITTPSIATILSEARKYGISLNIAHQFIDQLDEDISNAVFGNVGSMVVFRVGAKDAEFLVKQFKPVFSERDLISVDNYNAYVRMLANGKPTTPFSMKTPNAPKGNPAIVEKIKELSYLTYGRPRAEVEEEILARFQSI